MREESNSKTHLVNIVAEEVYNQRYNFFDGRIKALEDKKSVYEINMAEAEQRVVAHLLGNVTSSLKKAGAVWEEEEDFLLRQEVKTAITQIARNHNRSQDAIVSRILQRELIL